MNPIYFNSYSPTPFSHFSNFYPCKFIYKGVPYKSAEHAYQAAKCLHQQDAILIRNAATPREAKSLGKNVVTIPDWKEEKVRIMKEILRCKFLQNDTLRQELMSYFPTPLIHKAPWDSFWGDGLNGKGSNVLGRLLTDLQIEFDSELQTRMKGKDNGC